MTRLIGRFCYRHRWAVILIWVAAMAGGVISAGSVFEKLGDTNSMSGTESGAGRDLLNASRETGGQIVALWEGVDPATVRTEVEKARADLAAIPGIVKTGQITAKDGRGVAISATLSKEEPKAAVTQASERLRQLASEKPGSTVELGGGKIMNKQINAEVQSDLNRAEFSSLPLTVLIMVVVFGGLAAAGVPLIATIATVAARSPCCWASRTSSTSMPTL
jgi:RND superfamily putative drug exporter